MFSVWGPHQGRGVGRADRHISDRMGGVPVQTTEPLIKNQGSVVGRAGTNNGHDGDVPVAAHEN